MSSLSLFSTTNVATLDEDLDDSETNVDVSNGAAFAVSQTITIDDERMSIASIGGNTLTVTRGADGTTASVHTNGAPISLGLVDLNGGAVEVELELLAPLSFQFDPSIVDPDLAFYIRYRAHHHRHRAGYRRHHRIRRSPRLY